MTKIKRFTVPNAGDGAKQLEYSYINGTNGVDICRHFLYAKHTFSVLSSNATHPREIKHVYKRICTQNVIAASQKWNTRNSQNPSASECISKL